MPNRSEEVGLCMEGLSHPMKAEIEAVRTAILASNEKTPKQIIKRNAHSFCYKGDDRVTFRLQPKGKLQLTFHRGAKKRDDSKDFTFKDGAGLLEWVADDRTGVTLKDAKDVAAKKTTLVKLVNQWMR